MHASGTNILLLVLGFLTALSGAIMVGFGIPIKEFGIGNTLIASGTTAIIGGLILLGLAIAVRHLSGQLEALEVRPPPRSLSAAATTMMPGRPRANGCAGGVAAAPLAAATAVEHALNAPVDEYEVAARRSGVTLTKDLQDRHAATQSRSLDEAAQSAAAHAGRAEEPYPASAAKRTPERGPGFDSIWPPAKSATRAVGKDPAAHARGGGDERSSHREPLEGSRSRRAVQQVAILKSGVIDGMAYTVYADGSIEAELPQGVIRFGSIEELRSYLVSKEAAPRSRDTSAATAT
jgi:hypothetical protein